MGRMASAGCWMLDAGCWMLGAEIGETKGLRMAD